MNRKDAADRMSRTGRWIMEHRMTWGTAGNMSMRLDDGSVLITAGGTRFDTLGEEDFTRCAMDGSWTGRKPSKELSCHLAIYRSAPWAGAVIHASPYYATLAASSDLLIPNRLFVENMYYLQRVVRIGYAHPGSAALAEMIGGAAADANVILMRNHGVILYDTSMEEALCALEVLENTCRMALDAMRTGIALAEVSETEAEDFLLRSGYRPPRPWKG